MVRHMKTSDIARAIGVHVNTVRLYEAKGYLSPVTRSSTGYRQFTVLHLEQMRLAHLALQFPYPTDRVLVQELVMCVADSELGIGMEMAYEHLVNVRVELTHAEVAIDFLERWANGKIIEITKRQLTISQTAQHLSVTPDQLRNWDRSGLLIVPRDVKTGYRRYGAQEIGRLRVICMLRKSGYSTMSILRMLRKFDGGERKSLGHILNTPHTDEDIETLADKWLIILQQQEKRALSIIKQVSFIAEMLV